MAYRFWRRVKIAPGLTLNLSKTGASLSMGPRGAKVTVGSRGKRATVGIPGTGLFYTEKLSGGKRHSRERSSSREMEDATRTSEERLTFSFFKRLVTPSDERALIDGCRQLVLGDEEGALEHLRESIHLADGACLAGFLALKKERLEEAARSLEMAAVRPHRLGRTLDHYGVSISLSLPITDEVVAPLQTDLGSVLLGLVEVYQRQKQWDKAIECLKRLRRLEPEDVVVKLSLAELLLDAKRNDKKVCQRVVKLAEGIENETQIHTAILLQKARALHQLGLLDAARETLTTALRRKKGRPEELLRSLRYERALVYEEAGRSKRARSEFEKIYSEAPDYEDVSSRLGL